MDVDLICAENLAQRLPVSSSCWKIKASSGHHLKHNLQEIKETPRKQGDTVASRRNHFTLLYMFFLKKKKMLRLLLLRNTHGGVSLHKSAT